MLIVWQTFAKKSQNKRKNDKKCKKKQSLVIDLIIYSDIIW